MQWLRTIIGCFILLIALIAAIPALALGVIGYVMVGGKAETVKTGIKEKLTDGEVEYFNQTLEGRLN